VGVKAPRKGQNLGISVRNISHEGDLLQTQCCIWRQVLINLNYALVACRASSRMLKLSYSLTIKERGTWEDIEVDSSNVEIPFCLTN
jgi:hypothetical protein